MQFNIRAILCATTFVAISFGFGPDSDRGVKAAYYLYLALTALLALSIILYAAAARRASNRELTNDENLVIRERRAIRAAAVGIVPFATMWAFAIVEPHESRHDLGIDHVVRTLFFLILLSYVPAMLVLAASLANFRSRQENLALLVLRCAWLLMYVAVPLYLSELVLPRLG